MSDYRRARRTLKACVAGAGLALLLAGCSKELPNMVGSQLQEAQDTAQSEGFNNLSSTDVTGQGRAQVWDRNWRVCSQTPKPGEADPEKLVVLSVVKEGEQCPASTDGYVAMPGDEMPGYAGRNLMDSIDQMAALTGDVTAEDVTGKDRHTDNENDWRVCSTSPAPGEVIDDTVTFQVVKNNEKCPT
ncbi:hypothetical protein OG785_04305 [Streptomyces sp. NBC_00006]|uniref:hypothetical protein n=1 Tax=Streptomyces sp. NBC_00006 TaxID=2975619 RepID=UPI002253C00A|nr:hypothetical protein [Streptomyces sp. NBC_00006]MCX5529784.1 hypothetical protein [Streptomyces sp. NBC_00006]